VVFTTSHCKVLDALLEYNEHNEAPIRETSMFPPDFPNVTTIEVLFTNLTQDTEYNYTVRVLTNSNYFTAVEIPRVVSGTFPMTTPSIPSMLCHSQSSCDSVFLDFVCRGHKYFSVDD